MSWNLPYRYAQRSSGEIRDYVFFAAFDPVKGELRRKRIYLDHISNKKTRDRHAIRLIDHINKKLDAGQNPFIDETSKKQYTTIKEALQFVLDLKNMYIRKRTKHTFDSRMNVLMDWLKKKKMISSFIFELNSEVATTFMNSLITDRKIKGRTWNNYLLDYRTFFNTLIKNDYITKNPFHAIDKMREQHTNKRPFTDIEVKTYFEYIKKNDYNFYVMSLFIYYLALRPAEICRLRIGDFFLEKGIAIVPASSAKVREQRIIPIATPFLIVLKDYFSKYPSGYRICSQKFCPGEIEIAPTRMAEHFRVIADHLNIAKDVYFYCLKDTAADRLLDAGFTTKTIRDLFGHSNIAITDKYLKKIRTTIDRKLIDKFPDPF